MITEKSWYKSKGVIGGIMASIVGFSSLLGMTITPEEEIALRELVVALLTVAAGALSAYGRLTARDKIK